MKLFAEKEPPITRPGERPAPGAAPTVSSAEQPQRMIQRVVRDDQICVLTFDRPGSAANIFDRRTLVELGEELDLIAANARLKGVILTSAKRSIFIAGVDLKMLSENSSLDEVRELIELGQRVMNQLAALRIPTVAAVHGAALGGGYELCLACDYRVASADRATRLGLPETQLGLLPAWGGSTRLPRLIGLPKALEIILAGKTLAAKPALKCGMLDEIAHAEYLAGVAAKLIARGKPRRRSHWLRNNRVVAAVVASRARARLREKTRGLYPAVLKALEVVVRGLGKSIPKSLELERDGILELAQTEACHNLIRLFFLQEQAKKKASPVSAPSRQKPVARTAVLGAGVMGAGIAQWLSAKGLPVILRDVSVEQLAKGMASIASIYQEGAKRHAFTAREVRDGLDRIFPAPEEVPLRHVDVVIEAAAERLEIKKNIFRRLDELAGDDTILATNTSALPISELATSTRRPERVVGLHFFNPVHRMQLVEVVAARQTSPAILRRALSLVQQLGKLPVVVKDSPGFLVNRILMPYLVEAGNLFEAGASAADLDEAMLDFGMPMGPMCLLDEVGIDVALHVARTLAASFPERLVVPESLGKMAEAGLLGRKSGSGFYLHRKGKRPQPNPQLLTYQRPSSRPLPREALQERMVLLMVNEAARCLEERVADNAADIDFAMVMGTGFAPFRGGPLRYADAAGAANLAAAMQRLADSGAPHFAPCALFKTMAAERTSFYHE